MRRGVIFLVVVCVLALTLPEVFARVVPYSEVKTVEFFIGQDATQSANTTTRQYGVSFYLPETDVAKRHAWFEMTNILTAAVDNMIDVNLSQVAGDSYSIDSAGETQEAVLRYTFQPQVSPGLNGPYTLYSRTSIGGPLSIESAKMLLTYEYDSTSPRQLKTVKYLVGQDNLSRASGATTSLPFSIFLPETGIVVRSAFIEVTGVSRGNADQSIFVNTTRGTSLTASIDSSAATQAYTLLYNATELYSVNFPGTYSTALNVIATGDSQTMVGAIATITYEYDSNSTNQLRTIRYQAMELNNTYATNTLVGQNFAFSLAEDNIAVRSAFIKFNAWVTASASMLVNISNQGHRNSTITILTEGTHFTHLTNFTQAYALTSGGDYGPYALNYRLIGPTTTVPMAQLFLTYNYSTSSPTKTKTVEFGPFTDDTQRTANIDYDRAIFIITPEYNVTMKSVYMESTAVASSTGATHTLFAGFGDDPRQFVKSTTGETSLCYLLRNATDIIYDSSTGTNGAFQLFRQDNGIASVTSGKVLATYFFQ
jgi:hypothetical protein